MAMLTSEQLTALLTAAVSGNRDRTDAVADQIFDEIDPSGVDPDANRKANRALLEIIAAGCQALLGGATVEIAEAPAPDVIGTEASH
jgi:hypothetical protein